MEEKKSWGKRHPIISGLIVGILVLFFIGVFSTGEDKNSDSNEDITQKIFHSLSEIF